MSGFVGAGAQERVLTEASISVPGDARYLSIKANTAGIAQTAPATADQLAAANTILVPSAAAAQALTGAQQFQARGNIAAAQVPSFWTRQVFASGSGTYATPANCKAIRVRMIGAGGGGGGGTSSGGNGAGGGATTFGSSLLLAGGGQPGGFFGSAASVGGTASGGDINATGSAGFPSWGAGGSSAVTQGSSGATGPFGGNGYGGWPSAPGQAAPANSGGGGGGGGGVSQTNGGGGGGGGGAYCEKLIINPLASYSYAIGAGGTGGAAGAGSAGGVGGSGFMIVEEFY